MKKSLTNNIGLKLLAFVFAFLLWLMVVNVDDPVGDQTFTNIPVTVEHEEVITQVNKTYQIVDNTQTVSVVVTAKRSVLNRLKSEDIVAKADMKELYLESQVPIQISIPKYEGAYRSALAVPRNLQVKIENNASKNLPITPVTNGTVRDGYVIGAVKANPQKVTINGPRSVIEKISKVTAQVNVSGLSQDASLEAKLVLYDEENNVIDQSLLANNIGPSGVSVEVELYQTRNIPVKVDGSAVTAAEGYSITEIKCAPEEITVAGEENLMNSIDAIYVPADALQGEPLNKKTEKTVDITPYLPEGIKLADEAGNNILITISVEKDGTRSFDLPVGSISVKNIEDNLKMNFSGTDDLEIHVRGPKEVLDRLNITKAASIDLKGLTKAGDYTVPVNIELPSGCTLEGEVQIQITLEEKE